MSDAVRYLAQREHFERELRKKLSKKGYEPDQITDAIDQLLIGNLLSEERAFDAYLRSRTSRGMGPDKIKSELLQLTRSELISSRFPKGDSFWCKTLAKHWSRRFDAAPEWPINDKAMRHCVNRGFSYRLVRMMVIDYARWEKSAYADDMAL